MLCHHDNQGLWGIVCRYAVAPEAGPAYLATVVLSAGLILGAMGVAVLLLLRRRPEEGHTLALAATFYLVALFSPLAWRTNFIGVAPMLYVLLRWAGASRLRWVFLLPAASAVLGLFAYELLGPQALTALLDLRQYGLLSLATVLLTAWLGVTHSGSASPRGLP